MQHDVEDISSQVHKIYNLIDPVSLETMVIEVSGIQPHLSIKKYVTMIRKYHNKKLQTNPQHHEKEPQDI